jgi:8-oxo-dGTP diphosphatase
VALHDGNGWVRCRCGHRHWGVHGAAGLLLVRPGAKAGDEAEVLLQLRAGWTHQGGTWGLPGGARDSHEEVVTAALREAREEVGLDAARVTVAGRSVGTDHGDWRYDYVIAWTDRELVLGALNDESDEVRWVALSDVSALPLHPALAATWSRLLERLGQLSAA